MKISSSSNGNSVNGGFFYRDFDIIEESWHLLLTATYMMHNMADGDRINRFSEIV